jgi:hypothetical protein
VAPVLSFEDVVDGTGPGSFSWGGVRAQSVGISTATARVGGLTWLGVPASSTQGVVETSPTHLGAFSWSGIRALSTADQISLATVGSLSWAGIPAQTVALTNVSSSASVGSLSWSGISALSTAGVSVTNNATVGSFTFSGIPPILSIEEVVGGNGPGLVWWTGVPANSTTGAVDQTHLAHTGTILWSGIPARSRDATISGPICDPGLTLTVPSPGLELTTTCGGLTLTTPPTDLELSC